MDARHSAAPLHREEVQNESHRDRLGQAAAATSPERAASKIFRLPSLVSGTGLPPAVGSTSDISTIVSTLPLSRLRPLRACGTPVCLRSSRTALRKPSKPPDIARNA